MEDEALKKEVVRLYNIAEAILTELKIKKEWVRIIELMPIIVQVEATKDYTALLKRRWGME